MSARGIAAPLGGVLVLSPLMLARQSPPALEMVLQRSEQYVLDYEPKISSVVAREHYLQKLHIRGRPGDRYRQLTSDFLFLRLPGSQGSWLGIREVLQVDGRSVLAGGSRLGAVAVGSPEEAKTLAAQLAHENTRHNLGGFLRTVNVPMGVIGWLHPRLRGRFDFAHSGTERIDGVRVWRLNFNERDRPTVIRTPDGADVVSSGSLSIDPDTGRVWHTELHNRPGAIDVTIRVRFGPNDKLGLMVPMWMRERYDDGGGTLDTNATYRDFRRFEVTTRIK